MAATLGLVGGAVCGVALTLLLGGEARAADAAARASLWADGAPLASVLEVLLGGEGVEVRVADDITDRVEGRLGGEVGEIVALLAETHALEIHDEGERVWVDRAGRRIVDFVSLDDDRLEEALAALGRMPPRGGEAVAEGSGRGLILTGSRGYVQASLARLALIAPEADLEPPRPAAALPATDGLSDEEAGERLVLVSARPPRLLVLADGRRVGIGERLPGGARVVEITSREVRLEEDGRERRIELR